MKITFVDLTPYCRFVENLGSSDLESAIKVHDAYLRNCHGESIMDIGMNQYTGYVYFALQWNINSIMFWSRCRIHQG